MKRSVWVSIFCLLAVLTWNIAAGSGFYVIPAGKAGKRTVMVSQEGTATQSGTALLNALAVITDATATKPYLIAIEPGIYDLGSNILQMKSYVDIQGSGENVTTITGNVSGATSGVVKGADHVELRFLTVKNTGGGTHAIAICNDGASPRIENVTAEASGGTDNTRAVYNYFSSPIMTDVTASSSGGDSNCAVYNDTASPVMTNVKATASGGEDVSGVCNDNSSTPTMINVTAIAKDATYNTLAVSNKGSAPTMIDVTATATGGGATVGVHNERSYPQMTHVTCSGSGGSLANYGMYNTAMAVAVYYLTIRNSRLSGATSSLRSDSEFHVSIAATQLSGGAVDANGGVLKCVDSYDGDFVVLDSSCK